MQYFVRTTSSYRLHEPSVLQANCPGPVGRGVGVGDGVGEGVGVIVGEMVKPDAFFKGAPCFRKESFFKNPKPEFDEVTICQRAVCERDLPLLAYR